MCIVHKGPSTAHAHTRTPAERHLNMNIEHSAYAAAAVVANDGRTNVWARWRAHIKRSNSMRAGQIKIYSLGAPHKSVH